MSKVVGIIDEPVAPGASDNLDIGRHASSLAKFVSATETPITIGIQGEWGSGKTSLINSIYHVFENNSEYKQIWINSWEFSLLSTPEESLLKIVNKIIDELLEADKNEKRKEKIHNGAKKIFQGALRVGAQLTLGNEAANVASELLSSGKADISALRNQLKELVNEIERRGTNPYKRILIYVDDLDRIEPRNAVSILELLKNIFNVPNCVFVLAIDYQVIVKGLEGKFGKQTIENEWEFRAFFDKIIQLPFMMPMGQYNIGKYVNKLLLDIGFVEGKGLDENSIREIVLRTIGGNPRSIKRLVNSVSLIDIFTKEVKDQSHLGLSDDKLEVSKDQKKFLLFSLLCLQIAYPQIYSLLESNPNFVEWDEEFAFVHTKKIEEKEPDFLTEFNNACQTEDFNDDWEKAIFRICYIRPRLKARSTDISKFFNYIKDELLNDQKDIVGDIVIEVLNETSVTNVTSTDQTQAIFPERQGPYKRRYLKNFEHWLADKKNSERGYHEDFPELVSLLYNDLKSHLQDIEFVFVGGISIYVNSHKFVAILKEGRKATISLEILRHFEDDYKIPIIGKLHAVCCREYKKGKFATCLNGNRFILRFDLDTYKKEKKYIYKLIDKAYDMAKNHWEDTLYVSCKDGVFKAVGLEINNDVEKAEEAALRYLNNQYTYELK